MSEESGAVAVESVDTGETVETNETVETVEAAETTETNQAEPKPERKKYKVKVDNEEMEVDEDELIRGYAHNKAASKRMQEAAERRKQSEEFIELLRKDPKAVLQHKDLNIDVKALAEQILAEHMEEQLLTEDEKERRELKRKLDEYEQREQQRQQTEQQARFEAATAKQIEEFDNMFTEALNTSGLPKTRQTVARMAHYMQLAIANGHADVTAADVVENVRADYLNEITALFGEANDEVLMQLIGEQIGERISKAQMNKIKAAQKKVADKPADKVVAGNASNQKRKYMTRDEWRAELAERTGYTIN